MIITSLFHCASLKREYAATFVWSIHPPGLSQCTGEMTRTEFSSQTWTLLQQLEIITKSHNRGKGKHCFSVSPTEKQTKTNSVICRRWNGMGDWFADSQWLPQWLTCLFLSVIWRQRTKCLGRNVAKSKKRHLENWPLCY